MTKKLLETILTSEFTFGFEFEAYVDEETLKKYSDDPDYDADDDESPLYDTDIMFNDLKDIFSEYFGNDINIVHDGSLNDGGFEFPTPPMSLTPKNIQHCIKFLDDCHKKHNIYTNEDCGFHIHYSFPNMNKEDMVWIVCQIACNNDYINKLKVFETNDGKIPFETSWSKSTFLKDIKKALESDTPDVKALSDILSNDKYRLLRIHPQGTLEWRGPRNFLNEDNLELIKKFFYKLIDVAKMFADCMDKTTIGKTNISKNVFIKMLDLSNIDTKLKYINFKDQSIYEKIAKQVIEKPLLLTTLKDYKNFSYRELINVLEFECKKNGTTFENLLTELRYKEFKSYYLLTMIIRSYPNFINYVQAGLKKLIQTLLKSIGVGKFYRLINNMSFIKPEILRVIIDTLHRESFVIALSSYAASVSEKENGCLASKNSLKTLIDYYTFNKVDKAFARIGLNLTKFLN